MSDNRLFHRKAGHSVKVNGLTDFEFRVWWAYVMAADDFGILRYSHVELQSLCDSIAMKKAAVVMRALEHVVAIGLMQTFTHQGQTYIYQWDWQDWQKVKWPSRTINPKPPTDRMSEETLWLFQVFPGGEQVPKKSRESTEKVPSENLVSTSPRQQTLTTNATAKGGSSSEESARETTPPYDVWFLELTQRYPQNRVMSGRLVQEAFLEEFQKDTRKPVVVWADMLAGLENQLRGHEWRVKGMVPKLQNWLEGGLWRQRHEEIPVSERVSEKTARTLASAAAFVKEGNRGA